VKACSVVKREREKESPTTHVSMMLWFAVWMSVLVTVQGQINYSDYTVDTSLGLPCANGTVPYGLDSWSANSYCVGFCGGCQLAIARKASSVPFFYSLQAQGRSQFQLYSTSTSYLGLKESASGIWIWNDGEVCNASSPADARCYGVCSSDGGGLYAGIWSSKADKMDDFDITQAEGSLFCEVPCTNVLII
jgi:hypothetical protein